MYAAIIDYKPGLSKLDQTLFFKKNLKNCQSEIIENDISIKKYNLPICIENPSEKAMLAFCQFLKKENVRFLFVTEAVQEIKPAYEILSKNFSFFNGLSVINYKTCDIIRKYAAIKGKKLSDSSILLKTDDPKKAEDVIHQIYRRVKKISIETIYEERFLALCDFLLKEYGLFVPLNEKEKADLCFALDPAEKNIEYLNLSGDKDAANQIIFTLQNKKEYNQFYLEFLIFCQYGTVNKKTIKEFFNHHSVRISKFL